MSIALVLAGAASPALADPCTGVTDSGARFATCFDPGNRLALDAATTGFGGEIAIRHDITFEDEPDLIWKMSHELASAEWAPLDGNRFDGLLYRGIYVRHSRDGHIVLPTDPPKKIFLPFDIGALVEVGRLETHSPTSATLGIVETAALVDLARTRSARWRLAIGPSASWRVELDRMPLAIADHAIAPFSSLLVDLHGESGDGLAIGEIRGEAGYVWHVGGGGAPHPTSGDAGARGWIVEERAEASLERVVLAIDDRPVALYAAVRYESAYSETTAGVGLRVVLYDRRDPRVSLHPPQ